MTRRNRWRLAFGFFLVALAAWSVLLEPRWIARREQRVEVAQPAPARSLRVAVASDWHLSLRPLWRVTTVERARALVDEINAAQPDLVVLPGDFIADRDFHSEDGRPASEVIAAELGRLRAPLGVVAVLGNHDWWHDGQAFTDAFRRHGITVLENAAQPLPGTAWWIAGVGDDSTGHADPAKAVRAVPKGAPVLVVMHDPAAFARLPRIHGFALAAHTHGGQVYLPFIGAPVVPGAAPRAWAYGWIAHGDNRLYVTSGVGVSILPLRFNMRPEWVLFTLAPPREIAK
ncbi:metallophosphoesterase [Ramlibacter sp. USB13]|uniref:Metallophosphoesterase n=1 Tax=Ramlibacter cellulosilyticus TaxID=2764187 RepID=A0A923MS32_9BURK|nr:metallophosphoesterase [Ramlibacter cellulosilyticus]MBC5783936.1 metallophosphoesterase [Ramlibacter cellulosilyticus]